MYATHAEATPLTLVTDRRNKSDRDFDEATPTGRPHVMETYKLGRVALTTLGYKHTARVALFEHGTNPDALTRAKAKLDLLRYVRGAEVVCVLPTPSEDEEGDEQDASNVVWQCFGAPDSLANMRGTFFRHKVDKYEVMPLHAIAHGQKELCYRQQIDWLRAAHSVASGTRSVLYPRDDLMATSLDLSKASHFLAAMCSKLASNMLAVDIESIEATGVITAIGVSDGLRSVSVPFETYIPFGHKDAQPALGNMPHGDVVHLYLKRILGDTGITKVFHNHAFDVPRLRDKGFVIDGPIHDTFVAHAINEPELRHGLQHACANHLAIPPWKSLWHPRLPHITRDDIEYWICDPDALRDYNARDAFYTWHLADKLKEVWA